MAAISFTNIFDIINIPFGFVLRLCYQLTSNYGLAIILFTVIARAAMLPLAIKQQKTMANTVRMQPKLQELQKKYAKDKQKLSEAQMQLYQEEGASPLGGCLPMLIQLPIIYGLYNVIYKPLSYIVQLDQQTVTRVVQDLWEYIKPASSIFAKMTNPSQAMGNREVEIFAAKLMPEHMDKLSFLPSGILRMDFSFGPLDLSQQPVLSHFNIYLLIPLFCYLSTFVQIWLTNRLNKRNNIAQNAPGSGGMNTGMMVIMPAFTTFISFSVPAGIGLYWIASNFIMLGQSLLLDKFYNPKRLAEEFERASLQRKRERMAANAAREARNLARMADEDAARSTEEVEVPAAPQPQELPAPEEFDPDKKVSNKQQMEENRKRLAASREREKRVQEAAERQRAQNNQPHPPQKKKKKRRR